MSKNLSCRVCSRTLNSKRHFDVKVSIQLIEDNRIDNCKKLLDLESSNMICVYCGERISDMKIVDKLLTSVASDLIDDFRHALGME